MTTETRPEASEPHGDAPVTVTEPPTLGRLVADASRDLSALVRNEIALAKSEIRVSIRTGGIGAVLLAGAAFLGLIAIILLSVAVAFFISMSGLHLAWCFLIVFGAYVLLAAILGLVGVSKVKKVSPPEKAIEEAKESKQILRRGSH